MPFRLFNQSVTRTRVGYKGIDFSAFTHPLRKDRDFVIDMLLRINIFNMRFKEVSRDL